MNSNNPPEVIIHLTLADAETLIEDSQAAIGQGLSILNNTTIDQKPFAKKLVDLIEFKQRIKEAIEKGIKE